MIRKYTSRDRNTVYEMFVEFYNSPAVLHNVDCANFSNTLDEAERNSPYVALYVIEHLGQPAGYGQLSLTYSNEAGGKVVLVEEIFIRQQYRGCGLGSEFFRHIFNEYKDAKRFRLETEPSNQRAAALYLKLGFKPLDYLQFVKED